MHDQAIEARTQLKLDAETEHQGLELEDLRLRRKQEREKVRYIHRFVLFGFIVYLSFVILKLFRLLGCSGD
jgi:hypothetical protein